MKAVFKKSFALCLFVLFFSVAGVIATAAQTCNPKIIETTPTSRFTDNNDGTVTDTKTGLMWKKCSEGQIGAGCTGGLIIACTWEGALQQAQAVNAGGGFAGYTDWRVPNVKELRSIVEEKCYGPAINLTVFPGTPSRAFWSSSPTAWNTSEAWSVSFSGGYYFSNNKVDLFYVWLVRDGQ